MQLRVSDERGEWAGSAGVRELGARQTTDERDGNPEPGIPASGDAWLDNRFHRYKPTALH